MAPRRPLRYIVLLGILVGISIFYYHSSVLSTLSENANPENSRDQNGNTKEPGLSPGVATVIDSHRNDGHAGFDFPPIIHQTAAKNTANPASLSWWYANIGEDHEHYDDKTAKRFVRDHVSSEIYDIYDSLNEAVAQSDLFRYLVLREKGGVYADMDTTTLCPINAWIPREFDPAQIGMVIGIEVDEPSVRSAAELAEWGWASNFQFVQWVIMAKPGHEALGMVVDEVITRVRALAKSRSQTLRNLQLSSLDIVKTTGPGPFTDAMLRYLELDNPAPLRSITKPVLIKDILIMPVSSFAPNQRHSNSKSVKYVENIPEVLVMHGFTSTRTWADDITIWLKTKLNS